MRRLKCEQCLEREAVSESRRSDFNRDAGFWERDAVIFNRDAVIFNRDAARHVATNAHSPYAHARPTATVCAYHATHGDPGFYNDAARHIATKTTRADMTMREITTGNGGLDRMRACGGQVGGGIFAKTAKTPTLQSGVCGDFIAIRIAPKGRPLPPPCAYHAIPHASHLWRPYGFYNDAARRVATVFESLQVLD